MPKGCDFNDRWRGLLATFVGKSVTQCRGFGFWSGWSGLGLT
jgi:hypothetical protein